MATTFVLEEFDDATRDYLLGVKEKEGRGFPGVYAPVKNQLPTLGCCLGVLLVGIMIPVTLFSDIILGDPDGVALLQTAVVLLGGWMAVAWVRVRAARKSDRVAGHWVYADPLFLYRAKGEQVAVDSVDSVIDANFTHNYQNGAYQNSAVRLLLPGKQVIALTVNDERRAERLVVFFNYLAWARGPEGGERARLDPAVLGGLAKYVAHHENEPLDAEGNVNLDTVEMDVGEIPTDPRREGRAAPNVLPYLVMIVLAAGCYFGMRAVNVPARDDAIYEAVTKTPPPLEPRMLRAYLLDPRNRLHRDDVKRRLSGFYEPAVSYVLANGADPALRGGFADVLRSVREADTPIVSVRVKEVKAPAGEEAGAADRVRAVRTGLVDGTFQLFEKQPWGGPIVLPPDFVMTPPPPPIGQQLLDFVEAPEDAANAHFLITYGFEPTAPGADEYQVKAEVEVRDDIDGPPKAKKSITLPYFYSVKKAGKTRAGAKPGTPNAELRKADKAADDLKDRLLDDMVGDPAKRNQPGGNLPGFNVPKFEVPKVNLPKF